MSSSTPPSSSLSRITLKRSRTADCNPEPSFVYLMGIDNPFQPVRADLKLINYYECRTAKEIQHESCAYKDEFGVPVYNSWMTRNMLVCFLKSLTVGKMCLDGVTYNEAVSMFDYEGINVPSKEDAMSYSRMVHSIEGQSMGIGMNKRSETLMDTTTRIAESIVHAIMEWPQLDHGLESAFNSEADGLEPNKPAHFTCTPTRCWIRFMQPSTSIMEGYGTADATHALCKRRPQWFVSTLCGIGTVHSRLVSTNKIDPNDSSESAFFALEEGIRNDPSHHFVSTRVDIPSQWSKRINKLSDDAHRFACMVLSEVLNAGPFKADDKISPSSKYCRACVALAIKLVLNTPRIATMFASGCEDDKGTTPERQALSMALKKHHIKIIKWGNDENALVFPPSFKTFYSAIESPCVLLGFENMR